MIFYRDARTNPYRLGVTTVGKMRKMRMFHRAREWQLELLELSGTRHRQPTLDT
jgi:hypothetical protein